MAEEDSDGDAPPLPDEPPPLPGPPEATAGQAPPSPTGAEPAEPAEPAEETAPSARPAAPKGTLSGSAVAGGHTPESIARLPPKLRQRLVQRGILKEEDVQMAMGLGAPGPGIPPAASPPPATLASPGTPPEPVSVHGAVVKAKGAPPQAHAPALAMAQQAAAARVEDWARTIAMAKSMVKASAVVAKAPQQATVAKAPQQVYSAAPVIRTDVKRPAENAQDSEAKRKKIEGVSPADVRAAAARAEGQQAPVWVYDKAKQEPASPSNPPAPSPANPASNASNASNASTPPPPGPGPGPPLPPGWAPASEPWSLWSLWRRQVRVPHEGDHYFWNTQTNEVTWEHPAEKLYKPKAEKKPKFTEEHKILWTDLGKIIGRQGMNLKIIKASIGCDVHVPRQEKEEKDGKGKKGKNSKGKSKGKRDEEGNKIGRGIGDGSTKLKDDQFCTVKVTGETAVQANGGKRCIQIMLGYGRNVERALADLGVEAKMPSLEEMTDGKSKKKESIDPMDPASYSDAPVGSWSAGLKKPGQKGGGNRDPRDSKTANAERF